MKKKIFSIFITFFIFITLLLNLLTQNIKAASVEIPYFISIFAIDSHYQTTAIAYFEMILKGGLKTNINLNFSFLYSDSELYSIQDTNSIIHQVFPSLYLKSLNATINDIFGFLDFSLFMNDFKNAGYGGSYNTFYYSLDIDKTFETVYKISGYGIALIGKFLNNKFLVGLYGYQPTISMSGTSKLDSLDISFELFFEDLKISCFAGTEEFVKYRWALSLFFEKKIFSLLLTAGMEDISDYTDLTSIYLIFEQKFLVENFYEAFVIFSKPESYLGQALSTGGENTGILIKLDLGYKDKFNSFFAGIYTSIELRNYNLYTLYTSQYIKLLSAGILWRIDIAINLLNLSTIFSNIKFSFETAF